MDLEKMNGEYVKLKSDLEKVRNEIENFDIKANNMAENKILWKAKLITSKRLGDSVGEKAAEVELQKIDKEIKKLQEELSKKKEEVTPLKEKIDGIIKEIKEDPEMANHLNEVMSKKYDRKISKLEKEQNELIKKESSLVNLQRLVTEHPALANNLKGMFNAQKEITDLSEELKNTTDVSRANEIKNKLLPQAKHKLETNKTPLMAYITKKKLFIEEQDINELISKGFKQDAKGNIDLNATMNRNISSIKRQIKGNEKSIKDYKNAFNNINIVPTIPTVEPKWYQFGERFKNWYERTSNPLVERFRNWRESRSGKPSPSESADNKENIFKNSLKYEVVKDIVEQVKSDDLKQAKKERKEEDRTM